jgi:hypothetical protein
MQWFLHHPRLSNSCKKRLNISLSSEGGQAWSSRVGPRSASVVNDYVSIDGLWIPVGKGDGGSRP